MSARPPNPALRQADTELLAPDPASKLNRSPDSSAAPNEYARRAIERRSAIYAATRRSIAKHGLAKASVRAIAEESKHSVQTLYNLIGDREQIIAQSIKEHICVMASKAMLRAEYPNPVIAMADMHCSMAASQPRYTLNALASPSSSHIFNSAVEGYVVGLHAAFFEALSKKGLLRNENDIVRVARRVVVYSIGSIIDWRGILSPSTNLRDELIGGVASLMLRALRPEAATELELWLDQQQS